VPKPPWLERKRAYVAHLHDTALPDGALRVSLADKVHNARAILFDQRAGDDPFTRFNAGREDVLWYYDALARAFAERKPGPLADELRRTVDALQAAG
jgi:hypothetical protein